MSIDFVPARRSNGENSMGHDMAINRVDRKSRTGRPTSLYVKVSPEVIRLWGVRDLDFVTAHFDGEGIWELRVCRNGNSGFKFRICGPDSRIRTCPEGWGGLRLSCTKSVADKVGIDSRKFFELVDTKGASAFFIERHQGIEFRPARSRRA